MPSRFLIAFALSMVACADPAAAPMEPSTRLVPGFAEPAAPTEQDGTAGAPVGRLDAPGAALPELPDAATAAAPDAASAASAPDAGSPSTGGNGSPNFPIPDAGVDASTPPPPLPICTATTGCDTPQACRDPIGALPLGCYCPNINEVPCNGVCVTLGTVFNCAACGDACQDSAPYCAGPPGRRSCIPNP